MKWLTKLARRTVRAILNRAIFRTSFWWKIIWNVSGSNSRHCLG